VFATGGSLITHFQISAYIIYTTFITGFIFPVVVHWSWSETGWLRYPLISTFYRHDYSPNGTFFYNLNEPVQFVDFAGSAVVHITGGVAGLVGTWFMEPRHGRFGDENKGMFFGHSVPLINLGFCFLLLGFLCFNGGSELAIIGAGDHGTIVAKCFMNTIIAGAAGGVLALAWNWCSLRIRRGYADISLYYLMNGALAGMVAVAAGSNNLEQGYALLIGIFGNRRLIGQS
jgi:Amt family ammonium transporter